jgi:hypothetical protein
MRQKTGKAEDPVPCRYDGPYEQIKIGHAIGNLLSLGRYHLTDMSLEIW